MAGETEAQETFVPSHHATDSTRYSGGGGGGQGRHRFVFEGEGVETFITREVTVFKKDNIKVDEVLYPSQELFGTRNITTKSKNFKMMNSTNARKGT